MKIYTKTFLLSVAWALLIVSETQVDGRIIVGEVAR
jgi:hypothetical protein